MHDVFNFLKCAVEKISLMGVPFTVYYDNFNTTWPFKS